MSNQSKELSKFKIRLNIISPGNILNRDNNWYFKKKSNKKVMNYIKKNVPLNNFCKPEQIYELCNLLIDDKGSFFQGSNIVMDGGPNFMGDNKKVLISGSRWLFRNECVLLIFQNSITV